MKASYARPEQRRETRNEFPAGQLFIVDLISRNRGVRTFGIVLNISKGGMAVQTFRPLAAGHIAEIRHCFSKSPIYTGAGQVVWKKEGGLAGLRFLNGRLKNLPDLRQRDELDGSLPAPLATLPLSACRNSSSTDAFESTLHLLACSAMALTDAAGVAIVLGNSSVMQCRASAGVAPAIGTELHPDSGLSGHSLRTGSVILCDDAWEDPRVNMAAAREMDTRSILIHPITMAGTVVGLIEAFSPATSHFDQRHVERLQPSITVLASVPELETFSAHALPEEPTPIVADQETSAAPADVQSVEAEVSALLAEIAEEPTGVPAVEAEIASAELDIIPSKGSEALPRSRPFPLSAGVISALLILLAAMAFFTYRLRHQSSAISTPTIRPQNSQSSAAAGGQAAIALPKPEIAFDPPVINQKVDAAFGVNIVLKNAKDILSVPLQIHYDPQKLRVVTVASGGLFDRVGQPATLDRRVDSSAGTIDLTVSRALSVPGSPDSGSLVSLTFVPKVAGRSQLELGTVELHDSSNRVTLVNGAETLVDVSPGAAKPANPPAKSATAKKEPATQPAAAAAKSAPKSAPQTPAEAKASPEAPRKEPSSVAPEAPKQETGALIMEGVPPGSEVWLDDQPFTATAATGKVAIRNVPAGSHHLRMSLNNYQYYEKFIDLKPGEIFNVEPQANNLPAR